MSQARSRDEDEYAASQSGRMAPCDLCIITLPKSLFVHLSNEAAKRNMTFAQLLAASIDAYLEPGSKPAAPPQPSAEMLEGEHSNFEFTAAPEARRSQPVPAGTKRLKRFE